MSSPFIALTLPGSPSLNARPIFVNATMIREVSEHWQRKAGHNGPYSPENYELVGTYITTGSGEEGTFSVTESYGEVTGAIRDALA